MQASVSCCIYYYILSYYASIGFVLHILLFYIISSFRKIFIFIFIFFFFLLKILFFLKIKYI